MVGYKQNVGLISVVSQKRDRLLNPTCISASSYAFRHLIELEFLLLEPVYHAQHLLHFSNSLEEVSRPLA